MFRRVPKNIQNQIGTGDRTTIGPFPLWFAVWCYAVFVCGLTVFVWRASPGSVRAWGFAVAVVLTYALLFLLPVLVLMLATRWVGRFGRVPGRVGACLVVLVATASQLLLAADSVIHGMFGFHINGFVVNLITTPEGVKSMGADPGAQNVYLAVSLAVLVSNAAMWWWTTRKRAVKSSARFGGARLKWIVMALVLLGMGERVTYGMACLKAWPDLMEVASAVPGYQPFTYRSLAKRLGIRMERRVGVDAPKSDALLSYPARTLVTTNPEKPLNFVVFVSESLRADMLTPEIMPKTWAFAAESQRFTNHYSGGNGTRMAMFSAFYGMPGSYWFNFLHSRRSPVMIDRVQEMGYHMRFSTSAAFSYPEFDKTILSNIPASDLHPLSKGEGWISDRHHVGEMKQWLAKDDGTKPYFLFHFFESPHARYYFPPESVIRKPYLEELNYATVDLKRDIELVRNRYINAVHHLDSQLGEMIDTLRARGDLDHTVVIITGDHGEEFMENGRWGHNSTFNNYQLRVPLIVHMPHRVPAVLEHRTSHVDIVPTLMPLLGVSNPVSDYSTGTDLFSPADRLLTFADWDRIAICDGTWKAVFPLGTGGQVRSRVTTADDQPARDERAALKELGGEMVRLTDMMTRFTRKTGARKNSAK